MQFSQHAKVRGQQRGIPEEVIEIIVGYGEPASKNGGATEFRIKERHRGAIIGDLKRLIRLFERSAKKAVLMADDTGQIITVYTCR
jgi:hypothetical protein